MTGRKRFDELMNNHHVKSSDHLKRKELNLVRGWLAAFYHTNPDATPEDADKTFDAWLNDPVKKEMWEEHVRVTAKAIKRKKARIILDKPEK